MVETHLRPGYSPLGLEKQIPMSFFAEAGRDRILEKVIPVTSGDNGYVAVELSPVKGSASICGAMIEPK